MKGTLFRPARVAGLALLALSTLAACGSGSSSSNPGTSSTLNLGITDGPIDGASSVVLSIKGVELQPSGGGKAIPITFAPTSIDLLQDQNGKVTSLLSGVSLPAGKYEWIRLLLNKINTDGTVADSYIDIGGNQYPLVIPSGAQTGLKLVQGFTLTANQTANFTLDFMLAQSLSATAPPGTTNTYGQLVYFLVPAMRLVDDAQVGTLSGTIALPSLQAADKTINNANDDCLTGSNTGMGSLPNAHVYIFSGSNAILGDVENPPPAGYNNPIVASITYSSSTEFTYEQPFLEAGQYTVAIACGKDDTATNDSTEATGDLTDTGLTFIGLNGKITASGVPVTVTATNQPATQDF